MPYAAWLRQRFDSLLVDERIKRPQTGGDDRYDLDCRSYLLGSSRDGMDVELSTHGASLLLRVHALRVGMAGVLGTQVFKDRLAKCQ